MKQVPPSAITIVSSTVVETPPAAWDGITVFAIDAAVSVFAGTKATVYRSLQSVNAGHTPASSPDWWVDIGTAYAPYSGGTSYALNDVVTDIVGHRLYESQSAGNVGNALSDVSKWVDIGPTNATGMIDALIGTVSEAPNEIRVTFKAAGFNDHIALLNCFARTVTLTATDPVDGVVYGPETRNMVSTSGIVDAYTYFTAPIVFRSRELFDDLPALYTDLTYELTLTFTGATVRLGVLLAGLARNFGDTEWGFSTGIIDYSEKVRDAFGRYYFVERDFADSGSFNVICKNTSAEAVKDALKEYRAKPALYLGTGRYVGTWFYGRFTDFTATTENVFDTRLGIQFEGLT